MTILIRNARIIDPRSPLHQSIQDILISNGLISQIGHAITANADEVLDIPGLHVSPGWVDSFAHACDPGFEFRETLESFSMAAAAGGFTHALVIPNTQPAVQHKSLVNAIRERPLPAPVSLHPSEPFQKISKGKNWRRCTT